jgi:hypothetical protein
MTFKMSFKVLTPDLSTEMKYYLKKNEIGLYDI